MGLSPLQVRIRGMTTTAADDDDDGGGFAAALAASDLFSSSPRNQQRGGSVATGSQRIAESQRAHGSQGRAGGFNPASFFGRLFNGAGSGDAASDAASGGGGGGGGANGPTLPVGSLLAANIARRAGSRFIPDSGTLSPLLPSLQSRLPPLSGQRPGGAAAFDGETVNLDDFVFGDGAADAEAGAADSEAGAAAGKSGVGRAPGVGM